jgi:hypothetical protein
MLTLPEDLLTELLKPVMYVAHLIQINFTSRTFYWTDCDQDVYWIRWYNNHPITYDNISQAGDLEAGTLRLTVSNIDKTFSDLVQIENIQDKEVTIKRVFLDANLDVIGIPTLIYLGYTDEIVIDETKAVISVADELIKWQTRCPRCIHEGKCRWKDFKGTECGYTGSETWCDRSWGRCVALSVEGPVLSATSYDAGVPTDETAAANSAAVDDMTLVPNPETVGDYYRFGYALPFVLMKINVTTKPVGSDPPAALKLLPRVDWTIIWQYWNGTWALLPDISDETQGFTKLGIHSVAWSMPSDWLAIAGVYYVRAYLSVASTYGIATYPKGGQVWISDGHFLNFGGYRFVADLADKEIWWGKCQKSWVNAAIGYSRM